MFFVISVCEKPLGDLVHKCRHCHVENRRSLSTYIWRGRESDGREKKEREIRERKKMRKEERKRDRGGR